MSAAPYGSLHLSSFPDFASFPDLATALAHTLECFSAEAGTVHVLDSDGLLHLVASRGIPDTVVDKVRTVPAGKGMAGQAIERRQVVNVGNLQSGLSGDEPLGAPGLKRAVALPIFRGDAVIGSLGIGASNERTFSESEIAALLEVARSMAVRFLGSPQSSAA